MSAHEVQPPVYVVRCDHPGGCNMQHNATRPFDRRSGHLARMSAGRAGWLVRPNYGKGSRTAPDLCPAHRPEPTLTPVRRRRCTCPAGPRQTSLYQHERTCALNEV